MRFIRQWLQQYEQEIHTSLLIASLIFLSFFRARWAFDAAWESDEGCYLTQLGHFLGTDTSAICAGGENYFAPGTAWLWLPAGILAKALSSIFQTPLDQWLVPCVSLWSFVLWTLGIIFSSIAFRIYSQQFQTCKPLSGEAYLLSLAVPVLYFAVHATLMAHTAEFFMASLFFYFIASAQLVPATLAAILLSFIRYNDFPALFFVIYLWLSKHRLKKSIFTFSAALISLIIVSALTLKIGFLTGYGGTKFYDLVRELRPSYIPLFLIGNDWGVIFFLPLWSAALILSPFRFDKLSPLARLGWGWMIAEALLCLLWGGNGSRYGQRYLIGSFVGLTIIWIEMIAQNHHWRKWLVPATIFQTMLVLLTTSLYQTTRELGMFDPRLGFDQQSFLLSAIWSLANPAVWKIIFLQQFPVITLWLSFVSDSDSNTVRFALHGPGRVLLLIATGIAIVVLIYAIRRLLRLFHIHPHTDQ